MRKQEMLVLSTKERDRLKALHEVKRWHMTQRAAAQQLGVTDRWVRKLLVRVKKEGDGGIVHRLRGQESNRRLPENLRAKVLKLVKAEYGDFGPTLACEYETSGATRESGQEARPAPPRMVGRILCPCRPERARRRGRKQVEGMMGTDWCIRNRLKTGSRPQKIAVFQLGALYNNRGKASRRHLGSNCTRSHRLKRVLISGPRTCRSRRNHS
jgi:DNA-binding Lrp family transcriptional regulator